MTTTFTVEVDWDRNGTWTDETSRVLRVQVRSGFDQPWDWVAGEGRCLVTLDNHDQRFSPGYAGGALYGKLLPRRGVRVSASDGVGTWRLFTGYIESIQPGAGEWGGGECVVTCVDGLALLARQQISVAHASSKAVDEAVSAVVAAAYTPDDTAYSDNGDVLEHYGRSWEPEETSCLAALQEICEAVYGRFYVARDGTATYLSRNDGQDASETVAAMLGDFAYWKAAKWIRWTELIGYWRMNESSGSVAADSSGNDYDGDVTGAAWGGSGIGDGDTSAVFDGSGDLIDVDVTDLAADFDPDHGTLMVWVKVADLDSWTDEALRRVVYLAVNDNNRIIVQKSNVDNTFGMIYIAGGVTSQVNVSTMVETGWMCWIMTWDTAADEVKVYKDGVQVGTTQTGLGTWAGVVGILVLGAGSWTPTFVWDGELAHVALWNEVLSADEIEQLSQGPGESGVVITDYYVNNTIGSDTTGEGTKEAPWASIHHALMNAGDVEWNVIHVSAGTYAEDSGSGYLDITRVFENWVTVRADGEVTITDAGTGSYSVRCRGCEKVAFEGITFSPTVTPSTGTIEVVLADSSIRLTDCTVYSKNKGVYFYSAYDGVSIYLENCTIEPADGVTGESLAVWAKPGNYGGVTLTMVNCTCSGQSTTSWNGVVSTGMAADGLGETVDVLIEGGTFTGDGNYALNCNGGSLVVDGGTFVSSGAPALVWGGDGATAFTTTGSGSGFTATSDDSHALIVGQGTDGVEISDAVINAGDYGIVCKGGDGAVFDHVTVNEGTLSSVLFKGCSSATLTNSTIYASASGWACVDMVLLDSTKVSNLTVTDNTLIATGEADCMNWEDSTVDGGGGVCDRNTYNFEDTTGNVGDVRSTTDVTDLGELQGAWSGYDNPTNDANSIVVPYWKGIKEVDLAHLIAYWRLNESAGSTAEDASGHDYDGAATGVTWGQTGIGDGDTAAAFDGSSDYVNVYSAGLASAFNGAAGTLLVWAKVADAGVWSDGLNRFAARILASANNYVAVLKKTDGSLGWLYVAGGTAESVTKSTSETGWMCLALTWDKAADEVKAYYNGAQESTTRTSLGTWSGTPAVTTTVIGAASTTPANAWSGCLAHAALFDVALTAAQIANLAEVSA